MLKWLVTGREGGGRGQLGGQQGKVVTTEDPLAVLEEGNPNYSQIYSVNRYQTNTTKVLERRTYEDGMQAPPD